MKYKEKNFGFFLLSSTLLFFQSCSGTQATDVEINPHTPDLPTFSDRGNRSEIIPSPITTPEEKEWLLVTGGNPSSGKNLYLLSTLARESFPRKFFPGQMNDWNPEPLPLTPRAVSVSAPLYQSGPQSIKLLNFATGNRFTLYTAPNDNDKISALAVTPDEAWITFSVEAPPYKGGKILLLHVNSQAIKELPGTEDREPRFSTDGKKIYWIRNSEKKSSLIQAPFDGINIGTPEVLISSAREEPLRAFKISPVGLRYFYLKQIGKNSRLFLRALLDQNEYEDALFSTDPKVNIHEPSWSIDGKKIIFWSESIDAQSIQIYDLKKKSLETLINISVPLSDGEFFICPTFSKDMKEIYYASHLDYWYAIFKLTLTFPRVTQQLTDASFYPSFYCPRLIKNFKNENN
jgi:Tol biopolymer transport system component